MGRKSAAKQLAKNPAKEPSKVLQKRRDLNVLVDKLLNITSSFHLPTNTRSWELHLEIVKIVGEINNIEQKLHNKNVSVSRQSKLDSFLMWMNENGAQLEGISISEFSGYDLGLKANKNFEENSMVLTIPRKVMICEQDAVKSTLGELIAVDPLLQNMPNITLALFLLLEKSKPDSFWKPYIDVLPEEYSTILYFEPKELLELKPSPVFESSLKLYRNIARQYAYFFNKIKNSVNPSFKSLQDLFTYESYRWAVSTVMTRQNNIQLSTNETTAFIPLWDMCNHEQGKITTDFNKDMNRVECYALRKFEAGEQIFMFYGIRSNADLFLHNGFVYPNNQYDSLSLVLGVSSKDPVCDMKLSLLNKLGLAGTTHFNLYKGDAPISAELLAFIRIFNMNKEELASWSSRGVPGELVSSEPVDVEAIGPDLERRAYTYLQTRCRLLQGAYKKETSDTEPENVHRKNIRMLKECEVQILDVAIKYLNDIIQNIPTAGK